MADKKYTITAEAVTAMMTYSNITPEIMDDLTAAISTLMNAFEDDWKNIVGDHVSAYKNLLQECKSLMQAITADVEDTGSKTLTKAKTYSEILSQKIR